ncbi:hypothetical protein QEP67_17340 [Bacillus cereus group sp. MS39]|uniref:Phage protein n=1 Tax=Bacillus cereus group sp. MS39 TaxID=3041344 RepID=A0AAU8F040_9BACI
MRKQYQMRLLKREIDNELELMKLDYESKLRGMKVEQHLQAMKTMEVKS